MRCSHARTWTPGDPNGITPRNFWKLFVAKEASYSEIIAAAKEVEDHDRLATHAYSDLLERYPESELLWRVYGRFLEDVRIDYHGAQYCVRRGREVRALQTCICAAR